MADCSGMLEKALSLLTQATQLDQAGRYQESLKLYTLGIEAMMSVIKFEKNERINSMVRGKVNDYMVR